ncbi:hypothetical protein [Variovorax terrae]|uniref:Uncharacterized protein n=1 Tax=Variovorax terrae TaxID=2923278 RepID=A0A9X1VRH7_9BURK|nr:hypothetical protein [Variovorax terrae]MCJ0761997.1 hypothetical protein [Variovorax terrae]
MLPEPEAVWLLMATIVATVVVVRPVVASFTRAWARVVKAAERSAGFCAAFTLGSASLVTRSDRICSSFCWMALSRSFWLMVLPSIGFLVPTALASALDCCWVVTTTMRATVPAVLPSALLLLVKSSNSETLRPSVDWSDAAADAELAPVLSTRAWTRVVSGLTTPGLSAGAFRTKGMGTAPVSVSTASVPTTARMGYLPASSAGTCRVTLPLPSVRPEGSPLSQAPFLFLSRQTNAFLIGPSTTVMGTLAVADGAGDVPPPPPPQAARLSRATLDSAAPIRRSRGMFISMGCLLLVFQWGVSNVTPTVSNRIPKIWGEMAGVGEARQVRAG